EGRNHVQTIVGKPCAGKRHARIERGMGKQTRIAGTAPLTTNAGHPMIALSMRRRIRISKSEKA
ncbi:MAG: hypothetical protein ACRDWA_07440, partial [Acidimicrobiia bacterium]